MEAITGRAFDKSIDSSEARRREVIEQSLGREFMDALVDPEVTELNLNNDSIVWCKRLGVFERLTQIAHDEAMNIISLVADSVSEFVTMKDFYLEAEFPLDGSRFSAVIPPVSNPATFSLRKHPAKAFPLESYVEKGIMPQGVHDLIDQAIADKANIMVAGGTGSGKTTFVNSVIHELSLLCPDDRLLFMEDARELKSYNKNSVFFRSTIHAPMRSLVVRAMRYSPDRCIMGEIRSGEALDLLMLWNTGHPGGLSTVHANSAKAAFTRIERMIGIVSETPMQALIGEAIDLVIFLEEFRNERKLKELIRCEGFNPTTNKYELETLYAHQ